MLSSDHTDQSCNQGSRSSSKLGNAGSRFRVSLSALISPLTFPHWVSLRRPTKSYTCRGYHVYHSTTKYGAGPAACGSLSDDRVPTRPLQRQGFVLYGGWIWNMQSHYTKHGVYAPRYPFFAIFDAPGTVGDSISCYLSKRSV